MSRHEQDTFLNSRYEAIEERLQVHGCSCFETESLGLYASHSRCHVRTGGAQAPQQASHTRREGELSQSEAVAGRAAQALTPQLAGRVRPLGRPRTRRA